MDSLQLKPLVSLLILLTTVGCASVPKTSAPVSLPAVELASVVGSAEQGALVQLPADNTLGVSSVIVERTYFAASGLECRRLTHVDGTPIRRVACKGDKGVWRFSRDLSTSSIGGSTSSASNSITSNSLQSNPLSLSTDSSAVELSQVAQSNAESLSTDASRTTGAVVEQETIAVVGDTVITETLADNDNVSIKSLPRLPETIVEVPASFDTSNNDEDYEITSSDLYKDETNPPDLALNKLLTFDVKTNETLWSFAKRTTGNALNWEAIAASNGITNAKSLTSGSALNVPAKLVRRGE